MSMHTPGLRPATPRFLPAESWRGRDYFEARFPGEGRYWDSLWGRAGNRAVWATGMPWEVARDAHMRLYSTRGYDWAMLSPEEIGAAAAYQALRMWRYYGRSRFYGSLCEPELNREKVVGIAIAECRQMWMETRVGDVGAYDFACETAAAKTAARLYDELDEERWWREGGGGYERSAYGSSVGRGYMDDAYYDRPYDRGGYEPLAPGPVLVAFPPDAYAVSAPPFPPQPKPVLYPVAVPVAQPVPQPVPLPVPMDPLTSQMHGAYSGGMMGGLGWGGLGGGYGGAYGGGGAHGGAGTYGGYGTYGVQPGWYGGWEMPEGERLRRMKYGY